MKSPRPVDERAFRTPDRDFGILPFWFLNGELDPDEMRWQLKELRDKDMQGVVFHGRYGLEVPYLGETYLDRIRFGVEEANRLGLAAWIYDEMNWPSGTADKRVLRARPDLAQRYIECVSFSIRGPWFMCLTGEDSRYLDFERSTPVAMFAIGEDDRIVDLTPNLSFEKVVPWEVPPGEWRLCYIVEKRADYYIDALDPESTATFLQLGYEPYVDALGNGRAATKGREIVGFYSDEPAMHYFLTAGDNAIVPWTKDMFRRFRERNGYELRSRLVDLFFDLRPEAARTRYDFYSTTTEFYADAYYGQIHDWCRRHGVLLTAHLLYEEWLRQMVRVEGNPFRHYERMDVVAVDHLYPVIGTRDAPDQHVAMKLASSAAHHTGSERVICESFGGIFMDATMQRMKWIADWECVLGVNVVNPHGFHYTFEGARKRDWPPSMFYQYPWWPYYGEFSAYVTRVSEMLTGGRHVAKIAVLWPINAMFATYVPHVRTEQAATIEDGLNVLTDLLLRLHHDFDYLDEDVLARAEIADGKLRAGNEDYELVVVPPLTHVRASSVDVLERFAAAGGSVLGALVAPERAFTDDGLADVGERMSALMGAPQANSAHTRFEVAHAGDGTAGAFVVGDASVVHAGPGPERDRFASALDEAIRSLIDPDVQISNPEVFVLHRRRDATDIYFIVNTTFEAQTLTMSVRAEEPALWDPTSGRSAPATSVRRAGDGVTVIEFTLPPVGSVFVVARPTATGHDGSGAAPEGIAAASLHAASGDGYGVVGAPRELRGPWTFEPESDNALVITEWRAAPERAGADPAEYAGADVDDRDWQPVVAGAWSLQLPAEPERDWPIPVWYRIPFDVDDVPDRLALLVDGFSGSDASVWLNGEAVTTAPARSRIDAQMKEIEVGGLVRRGRNVLAVRVVVESPTGGLVDHVKLLGSFAVGGRGSGARIVAAPRTVEPGSWTDQGYPYLSGCGAYRTTVELDPLPEGGRVLVDVPMRDDVLDVEINGRKAGVRLWHPYVIDVTDFVRAGANSLALRVANTPANLLNGVPRPSGLSGAPSVVVEAPPEGAAGARTAARSRAPEPEVMSVERADSRAKE